MKPITTSGRYISWHRLYKAGDTSWKELALWKGHEQPICPKYACGECSQEECHAAHLMDGEFPHGYTAFLVDTLEDAVKTVAAAGAGKRRDGGDDNTRGDDEEKKRRKKKQKKDRREQEPPETDADDGDDDQ